MNSVEQWHGDIIAERTVEALKKNGFTAEYCPDAAMVSDVA